MPNTPYNLTTNVTLESALPLDSDITSALQQATLLISGKLQQFADDSAFGDKIQVAFGTAVNTDELQSQWQAGDLTGFPIMEIVAGNDLNGANGAYAIVNNRIYLSYEFLSQNQGNLGAIVALLLEEYGHYVDGLLNSTDAPGDEGAIFASLVLGESLSEEALAYMKAEDDAGVISIGGVLLSPILTLLALALIPATLLKLETFSISPLTMMSMASNCGEPIRLLVLSRYSIFIPEVILPASAT